MASATGTTSQMTVTSTPLAVTAPDECFEVTIGEDPSVAGWPTTNYNIRKPLATSTPRQVSAGATYTFSRKAFPYRKGEVVGYVDIPSGSTTFFKDAGSA